MPFADRFPADLRQLQAVFDEEGASLTIRQLRGRTRPATRITRPAGAEHSATVVEAALLGLALAMTVLAAAAQGLPL